MGKTLLLSVMLTMAVNCFAQETQKTQKTVPQFKSEKLTAIQLRVLNRRGLIEAALEYQKKLKLDSTQLVHLEDGNKKIGKMKQQFADDSIAATLDSINEIDHLVAINILTNSQLKKIVQLNYWRLLEERDKIWNRLDSAQMISDIDENYGKYVIQDYLVNLRVAEEINWNNAEKRKQAVHQVKVYAPQIIKRYFATKPKKKTDKTEKTNIFYW